MPDWVGSVVTAAVAALAVIVTNLLNRREASQQRDAERRERQKDRDHQLALAAAEREYQLLREQENEKRDHQRNMRDKWRDARQEVHLALLASLDQATELVQDISWATRGGASNDHHRAVDAPRLFSEEFRAELRAAIARVQIIGSAESIAAGNRVVRSLISLEQRLYLAGDHPITILEVRARLEDPRMAYLKYIEAIRKDLGTLE